MSKKITVKDVVRSPGFPASSTFTITVTVEDIPEEEYAVDMSEITQSVIKILDTLSNENS